MIENESPGDEPRAIAPAECLSPNPFADNFEGWHNAGVGVLWVPLRSKKLTHRGFTGYDGVNASYADRQAWRDYCEPGNIAARLPHTVAGIDVDDYGDKHGARTIAEHEARLGALPATYSITSRQADGPSRIRLYRVQPGDVEIIQWFHRYTMLPGSIHPEERIYHGYLADGTLDDTAQDPATFAELPQAWIDDLSKPVPARGDVDPQRAGGLVAEARTGGEPTYNVNERLQRALADLKGTSRYDHTVAHVLALLRLGQAGEAGVDKAITELRGAYADEVADARGGRGIALAEYDRMVNGAGKPLAVYCPTGTSADERTLYQLAGVTAGTKGTAHANRNRNRHPHRAVADRQPVRTVERRQVPVRVRHRVALLGRQALEVRRPGQHPPRRARHPQARVGRSVRQRQRQQRAAETHPGVRIRGRNRRRPGDCRNP